MFSWELWNSSLLLYYFVKFYRSTSLMILSLEVMLSWSYSTYLVVFLLISIHLLQLEESSNVIKCSELIAYLVALWPVENMVEMANNYPESSIFEPECSRNMLSETKDTETGKFYSETEEGRMREISANNNNTFKLAELTMEYSEGKPCEEITETEELAGEDDSSEKLERGVMQYGCQHYRRRCRIRAPCCNEVFDCRHCHNEAKNNINVDQKHRHEMPRRQMRQVICSLCGTEQEVRQTCISCGVCMGKYFCGTCKLYDDDISKNQYHCDGCGICRIGGQENFFHCDKCGCCYSVLLKNSHSCVEGAMHHDCPICFEFLFESRTDVIVLPCGHTIHKNCLKDMRDHYQYTCPLCSKSVCDMSKVWEKLDVEIASTPMPEPYQNKMVWILCNDCGKTSQVNFHVLAQKCLHCKSYNTRQTKG